MSTTRREFLGSLTWPAAAGALGLAWSEEGAARAREALRAQPPDTTDPEAAASDEDFWFEVAQAFTVDRSIVNLNHGGVSPSPATVQQAMKRHLDFSNTAPAWALWQVLEPQREGVRRSFAREWGVDPEEVAFTRNSSESLQTCQLGLDLKPGDEVVASNQDYPRMLTTFRQRERREGLVLKTFSLPVPAEDPAEVVRRYEAQLTPRTRLILCCHVINLTGQILPVKDIVALGRRRGIPVIVDGAHSLAHFDFRIPDLDCDYFASSLHKWLFAPHGTGLLYVRRDRIAGLWPLMAAPKEMDADIRKFEEIGTHPAANALAIAEALAFHQGIGGRRKEARLRWLRDRWAKRLLEHDRVRLHTSLKAGFSCGLANVEIDGIEPAALADWLWKAHRILVVAIQHDEFRGIRVTPSLSTTVAELDRFGDVMEEVIRKGLPK